MDSTQLDLIRLKKLLSVTYILVKIVLTQLTLGTLVTFGLKRNWDNFTSALSWYVRHAVRHIVLLLPVFCIISVNMEEWRQCGRWLIDCKVLPPNQPGRLALSGGVWPGPGAQRWGAPVPDAAQSVSWIRGPKADQLPASNVTGKLMFMTVLLMAVF